MITVWSRRTSRISSSSSVAAIRLPRTRPRVRAVLVASSTSSCGPTTTPDELSTDSTSVTPRGTRGTSVSKSGGGSAARRAEDQPHDQRAEDQADDQRDDGGADRVHEMIVGA